MGGSSRTTARKSQRHKLHPFPPVHAFHQITKPSLTSQQASCRGCTSRKAAISSSHDTLCAHTTCRDA